MAKINLNTSNAMARQITKSQAYEIRDMYKKVSKDVQKKLDALKGIDTATASLQKVQLMSLQKSIKSNITNLTYRIEDITKSGMAKVAGQVVDDNKKWLESVGFHTAGTMQNIPTQVVEAISTGKVYEKPWSLSEAIWGANKKTLDDIDKIVAVGTAQGKSTYDIAKDLEKYVNPSAKKDWEWSKVYPGTNKTVDYSAQRLARTMVGHAYDQSVITTSKPNPFVTGIRWHSAHAAGRTCSLCLERDGNYYDKDEVPMDHPNGLCTLEPDVNSSMTDVASRIADWYNGNPDPELDDFNNFLHHGDDLKFNKTKSVLEVSAKANQVKQAANTASNGFKMVQTKYNKETKEFDKIDIDSLDKAMALTKDQKWALLHQNGITGGMETKDYTEAQFDAILKKAFSQKSVKAESTVAETVVESQKDSDIRAIYDKMLKENNSLPTTSLRGENMPIKYVDWYNEWSKELTEAESAGIHTYTGGSYSEMNRFLRGISEEIERPQKDAIREAKKALKKSKLPEDVVVRRGSNTISLAGLKGESMDVGHADAWLKENFQSLIGTGVQDKGFMSTSPLSQGGFSSRGVEYIIKLPKGTEAAFVAPISNFASEQEILLNAGTKFIIKDIVKDSEKGYKVYMEAIVK